MNREPHKSPKGKHSKKDKRRKRPGRNGFGSQKNRNKCHVAGSQCRLSPHRPWLEDVNVGHG